MTPEELDEARAEEATRIWEALPYATKAMTIAARLAREGWTPPPKVEPDLLAAREWLAADMPNLAYALQRGDYDTGSTPIRAFLAGIKHGRANP